MRSHGRPALLPPGWIVFVLFALYPVFWLLGLAGFVWAMASLPLLVWLLLRPGIERPPTVTLYTIYIGWALFSIVRLDSATRVMTFGLRYGAYLTAALLAYYVYNERRVSRTRFINWISLLWVYAIVGGYIGLLFPRVRLTTPFGVLLPNSIANDEFIANFANPRLAQVQNIFGVELPRPTTLFAFTNDWGANVGLLTPFFVAATIYSGDQLRRRIGTSSSRTTAPSFTICRACFCRPSRNEALSATRGGGRVPYRGRPRGSTRCSPSRYTTSPSKTVRMGHPVRRRPFHGDHPHGD